MNAKPSYQRRLLLGTMFAVAVLPRMSRAVAPSRLMEVWKDPTCGCCRNWVAIVEAAGFGVTVNDARNAAARRKAGIATRYGSCHTALVEGYAIEGHVPVREIERLLKDRPAAIGLAVPGMVVGSPGMEQGTKVTPYTVLLLTRDGGSTAYAKYG